ncbi:hypothetical protein COEREDRAFT_80406 [Coemansia reversa NRRL 1564]|uniref:Uncharacterized protein n=1 Tax=Coemansia reversa (strain ATCC 12441 / NRRL 1564) TaxID=763665 RepID=A0A2G5BFJ6_COERN|nr:hypothetical protein COEREDRAFT_80406 [Coemansia reversa NRRL 1564]|eukprot:PIA17752.1 hypothetical protein COEREDRAFT_80406 [Coemansia reversa NRRL 1564]
MKVCRVQLPRYVFVNLRQRQTQPPPPRLSSGTATGPRIHCRCNCCCCRRDIVRRRSCHSRTAWCINIGVAATRTTTGPMLRVLFSAVGTNVQRGSNRRSVKAVSTSPLGTSRITTSVGL